MSHPMFEFSHHHEFGGHAAEDQELHQLGRVPKMNFPWFEGQNHNLWLTRCEDYFSLDMPNIRLLDCYKFFLYHVTF